MILQPHYDLVVALDPSTASDSLKSCYGFAVFETTPEYKVLYTKELKAFGTELRARIKSLTLQLAQEFKKLEQSELSYIIFCEQFVMVGKGGESLQRMIGATMAIAPGNRPFEHVNNLQVKAFVGGTGKAQKIDVAKGLKKFFKSDDLVDQLIQLNKFDATDALAIGVTGYEKFVTKSLVHKKPGKKPKAK